MISTPRRILPKIIILIPEVLARASVWIHRGISFTALLETESPGGESVKSAPTIYIYAAAKQHWVHLHFNLSSFPSHCCTEKHYKQLDLFVGIIVRPEGLVMVSFTCGSQHASQTSIKTGSTAANLGRFYWSHFTDEGADRDLERFNSNPEPKHRFQIPYLRCSSPPYFKIFSPNFTGCSMRCFGHCQLWILWDFENLLLHIAKSYVPLVPYRWE